MGLVVGVVSSMLGVAGGELLIPALVFVFGADIRIAGSASLLISLAIVATGVWRYHRVGALPMTGGPRRIAMSMSAGSVIGAALGGLGVAVAPIAFLEDRAGVGSLTRCGQDHPADSVLLHNSFHGVSRCMVQPRCGSPDAGIV